MKALNALGEQSTSPNLTATITDITDTVNKGGTLADALGRHSSFSSMYVSMVSTGEMSGSLDISLQRLSEMMEKDRELASSIKGALT